MDALTDMLHAILATAAACMDYQDLTVLQRMQHAVRCGFSIRSVGAAAR
jgi:hypothetical protein